MHLVVRLLGREFLVVQAGIDDPEAEEEYEPTLFHAATPTTDPVTPLRGNPR